MPDAERAAGPRPEVVTLGECLVSFVASDVGPFAEATRFGRYVAGAEANVAVGLARLGHRVVFIGRVGGDGFGTAIVRALRGEGVAVDWLRVDESAPTGITPALSASSRAAVDCALDHARRHGLTVSLDLNLRRKLWSEAEARPVLAALAGRCDIVCGDVDEAAVVTGLDPGAPAEALLDGLLALGPSMAVLKLGRSGAAALDRDGTTAHAPALAVEPLDPVGAGDAFCAGLIAASLEELALARRLEMAVACGASAVATMGDQSGLPDRTELDRLLAGSSRDAIR